MPSAFIHRTAAAAINYAEALDNCSGESQYPAIVLLLYWHDSKNENTLKFYAAQGLRSFTVL